MEKLFVGLRDSFAAIDLIVNDQSQLQVLEVNSNPVDILSDGIECLDRKPLGYRGSISARFLDYFLRNSSLTKTNLIILSSGYDIQKLDLNCVGQPIEILDKASTGQTEFAKKVVKQANLILHHLTKNGVRAAIVTAEALLDIDIFNAQNSTVLFSRDHAGPLPENLTDHRRPFRIYCGDKRNLGLPTKTDRNPFVATSSLDRWIHPIEEQHVIVKPTYGYGSLDVSRVWSGGSRFEELLAKSGEMILQPWVKSYPLVIQGGERQFDLRAYVLEGHVIGCVVRIAAAPRDGIAEESELSWLTTLGTTHSLSQDTTLSGFLDTACPDLIEKTETIVDLIDEEFELWASSFQFLSKERNEIRCKVPIAHQHSKKMG